MMSPNTGIHFVGFRLALGPILPPPAQTLPLPAPMVSPPAQPLQLRP
jgi:hypothetical protein